MLYAQSAARGLFSGSSAFRTTRLVFLILAVSVLCQACSGGMTLEQIDGKVYRYGVLADTLAVMDARYGDIVDVEVAGETHEGRNVYVVRVGAPPATDVERPEILALFAQHSAEHTMTNLAVGLIRALASQYGVDSRVTALLDSSGVWIAPMVNPDGVEWDLSGEDEPYRWRKNRTPLAPDTFGVDLNRNWARLDVDEGSIDPEQLVPSSDHYWGPSAFSEPETRSIRDFIQAHPNLKFFLDYHTGTGGFVQGVLGCWMPELTSAEALDFCTSVVDTYAEAISDPSSSSPAFQVIDEPQDVVDVLHEHAPFLIRWLLPDELPQIAGISTDYVSGELDIPGIGLEIVRDQSAYFDDLPDSQKAITERHLAGLLYLLQEVLKGS